MSEENQLGTLLLASGHITHEQLRAALAEQATTSKSLGRIVIDSRVLSEADLVSVLAGQLGLAFIDLDGAQIDVGAAGLISDTLARRYQALPIGWDDGKLVLAMADPGNVFAIDDIRTITKSEVRVVVTTPIAVMSAIDRLNRMDGDAADISAQAVSQFEVEEDLSSIKEVVEDAPIVRLVNLLITQAVADRASDIHIEPSERDVRVRYRIDGVLHEVMRPQKSIQSGMISRLKIMADINIAERRVPQDGRITVSLSGRQVDLRVATLPTVFGEKIVMRILDKSTAVLKLSDLGFLEGSLERFAESYRKPYGTLLVPGPT